MLGALVSEICRAALAAFFDESNRAARSPPRTQRAGRRTQQALEGVARPRQRLCAPRPTSGGEPAERVPHPPPPRLRTPGRGAKPAAARRVGGLMKQGVSRRNAGAAAPARRTRLHRASHRGRAPRALKKEREIVTC
jgi:hypothetical protein